MNPKNIAAVVLLATLAGIAGVQTVRLADERAAHANTTAAWAEQRAAQSQSSFRQSEMNRDKEQSHAAQITQATDAYLAQKASRQPDDDRRYADATRLQRSAETRAAQYRAMSEAGEAERERLAGHATRLDAALADGRVVAEQLRVAVVDRDQRIGLLGAVIEADRRLGE